MSSCKIIYCPHYFQSGFRFGNWRFFGNEVKGTLNGCFALGGWRTNLHITAGPQVYGIMRSLCTMLLVSMISNYCTIFLTSACSVMCSGRIQAKAAGANGAWPQHRYGPYRRPLSHTHKI
jgi:hypothetical protein